MKVRYVPSEETRQAVHIAMGGFALLLRFLTWWQAAACAALALAFNLHVLPRIGGTRLYRPADQARGYPAGIILYPLAVLVLILLFPFRPDIVAGAWGILAAGDGMATIVGRRRRGRPLPWNQEKTRAGSTAFLVCGGTAGAALAVWCRPAVDPLPSLWFSLAAPFAAALVAAAVESIPVRLDDNLSVPFSAAGVLWVLSLTRDDLIARAVAERLPLVLPALAVNAVVAWAGYRAATVSTAGAVCGATIGVVVYVATGAAGWLLLLATFLSAAATSRIGLRRKTILGIAEARGGRRGAGNAIANTGVAAVAALLAISSSYEEAALLAFVTALAAGGSDTIASEIGKAWGRHAYLVPSFKIVPPGTSGAVSLEGTAAGLVGASALGGLGVALGLVPGAALGPVVIGATLGAFVESWLGATLEGPGILNNDLLNFVTTASAALCAIAIAGTFG